MKLQSSITAIPLKKQLLKLLSLVSPCWVCGLTKGRICLELGAETVRCGHCNAYQGFRAPSLVASNYYQMELFGEGTENA